MSRIILVGGEGYIGKVISKYMISKERNIISFDNLIYNQDISNIKKNFKFIKGDIRNESNYKNLFKKDDQVVILAGLVGDPITKKYPVISEEINNQGIKKIIDFCLEAQIKNLIFVSTCSNYGLIDDEIKAKENHKLNPLSNYSIAKVKMEEYLLSKRNYTNSNITILRFSTAFGLSDRMRYDLTVNEFVKEIYFKKTLEVYDPDTWRPYCHVKDFARVILKILSEDSNNIYFEIFNVGNDKNNFTKRMIIDLISKKMDCSKVKFINNKGTDLRNYRVDFEKLEKKIDITCKYSLENGIDEITDNLKTQKNTNFDNYGNYYL